ncbi:MAG TPA: Dam family site-specific DNA-(adenine-N6)-methyltransferase [Pyrinomonadaceae bacterium]|nr:Dam family site-specific DNA-(adenine-N6)-methyltransferase [Pyrinomonadaceae bacterium]
MIRRKSAELPLFAGLDGFGDKGGFLESSLSPPLKWAGGKRWLVPSLLPIWREHKHRRLVEPFCGGLSVALGLMPERALLNDVNQHLINFYRQIKRGLRVTIAAVNDGNVFYSNRARFNELIKAGKAKSPEAAQLFYYLNRTGYNGLCRFNRSGLYNVPFGSYKTINYVSDFLQYRSVFARWEFSDTDFEKLEAEPTDFVYADPPYDVEFTTYSAGGFTWEDQQRVAEWLGKHRGVVVLSNQATPRIVKLYTRLGFELQYFNAPRRISCNGDRTAAREVLATKNL